MSSSKLWLSLVVCVVACGGSSFHSGDASGGSDGTGATGTGGDVTTSGGQLGSSGNTGHAGTSSQAGSNNGGGASSGGDTSAAGTTVSSGGDISIGGDVAVGGSDGGGVNGGGGGVSGGGTGGSSGGSGGTDGTVDCSSTGMLWVNYLALVNKAKVCNLQVDGQCTANSNIVTQANCPIPVNSKSEFYDEARKALDAWKSAGCTFKLTMCQAQVGVLGCQPTSDGTAATGTCGYAPIVAQ